jgi:hypothetical protein
MRIHEINIVEISSEVKFQEYYQLGLIDEVAFRNYRIRAEYQKLRETETQIEAIFQLTEKYFLSFDSINSILFRKRNLKPILHSSFITNNS